MLKTKITKEEFLGLLKEVEISQIELSTELGISETTVNKWFKVNKMPLWVEKYLRMYKDNRNNKRILLNLKETNEYLKTVF